MSPADGELELLLRSPCLEEMVCAALVRYGAEGLEVKRWETTEGQILVERGYLTVDRCGESLERLGIDIDGRLVAVERLRYAIGACPG